MPPLWGELLVGMGVSPQGCIPYRPSTMAARHAASLNTGLMNPTGTVMLYFQLLSVPTVASTPHTQAHFVITLAANRPAALRIFAATTATVITLLGMKFTCYVIRPEPYHKPTDVKGKLVINDDVHYNGIRKLSGWKSDCLTESAWAMGALPFLTSST